MLFFSQDNMGGNMLYIMQLLVIYEKFHINKNTWTQCKPALPNFMMNLNIITPPSYVTFISLI